jgi:hypothetical protein
MTTNNDARVIVAIAAEQNHDFIWEQVNTIQQQMFAVGRVAIKVAYYGREVAPPSRPFMSTRWATDSDDLADLIDHARSHCVCGCFVEIADLFAAALAENQQAPVKAVIVIGDLFNGDRDATLARARELSASGTRLFLFQQNSRHATHTEEVFRTLAEQTGGAYFAFNPHVERVAQRLPALFEAVTHFAIGGKEALEALANEPAALLLEQIPSAGGHPRATTGAQT